MKNVINLYKPVGLSPLQVIEKFRLKHREYGKVKLGYAGRLDPMAEGVLMVLVGDENKKIRDYLKFDKEYRAEILQDRNGKKFVAPFPEHVTKAVQ